MRPFLAYYLPDLAWSPAWPGMHRTSQPLGAAPWAPVIRGAPGALGWAVQGVVNCSADSEFSRTILSFSDFPGLQ
jgi:hypothetical protein